jgi:hypothetical protein
VPERVLARLVLRGRRAFALSATLCLFAVG